MAAKIKSEYVLHRLRSAGVPEGKLTQAAAEVFNATCVKTSGSCRKCKWPCWQTGEQKGGRDLYVNQDSYDQILLEINRAVLRAARK